MTREEAARDIADESWWPNTETTEFEDGITVTKSMFISNEELDARIALNNLCDLADRRDAEDEERRMEG